MLHWQPIESSAMKIGDLVRFKGHHNHEVGLAIRIDEQFYGRYAFLSTLPKGTTIRADTVDMIATTKKGKEDRILVLWHRDDELGGWEYCEVSALEVVNELK